jgi:hypothetical protein
MTADKWLGTVKNAASEPSLQTTPCRLEELGDEW